MEIDLDVSGAGVLQDRLKEEDKTAVKDIYLLNIDLLNSQVVELKGLIDEDGNEVGGDKYIQFNIELLLPIFKEAGFVGLAFFDTGDVYSSNENFDLGNMRETAGFGFRWYSPMGPLRFEFGHILDMKDTDEKSGRWEFSVGQAF